MTGQTPGRAADGERARTPLAKKLGIRPGQRVRIAHCPTGWEIPGLPEDCEILADDDDATTETQSPADVTLAFYGSAGDLAAEAPALVEELGDAAMLWIAWPRRAAGHDSDVTGNALREVFLPLGIVDVKVAALDEDWSGLKFVRRKENRSPR